ncbi:hypothetical protein ACVXZ4_13645 [Lacisediminihabitans sp. FW035]
MKSFEDILNSSPDAGEARFIAQAPDQEGTTIARALVALDDSELPAPVSSFEHVARSTASRESLVPPKPIWPFGLRAHPHRQAS